MIQFNNHNTFKEIHYDGHDIKYVYGGCSGDLVWQKQAPPFGGKYKLTLSNDTVVTAACDSTSAITRAEIEPYKYDVVAAEIGDCVTLIDDYAFAQCYSLSSLTIGNNVATLKHYAFEYCYALSSVTIPSSVTYVDDVVFLACSALTSVIVDSSTPPTAPNQGHIFQYTPIAGGTGAIYVPAESLNAYKTAPGWNEFASNIQVNPNQYIDLELPSGTKWAAINVNATSETDYGAYYKYGKGATSGATNTQYYGGTEDPLAASADTATKVWGGAWHMPTKAQFEELTANTTNEWTTINGVNGAKFTAQNGKYVFFPAAGNCNKGTMSNVGTWCYYWGSTPSGSQNAYYLSTGSDYTGVGSYYRYAGYPVRPVIG